MELGSEAPAGSRQLTTRELMTVRAALRLWQMLHGEEIPDDALAAAHAEILPFGQPGRLILGDDEIEQLLVDLALAGDVVITALQPEARDRRRV